MTSAAAPAQITDAAAIVTARISLDRSFAIAECSAIFFLKSPVAGDSILSRFATVPSIARRHLTIAASASPAVMFVDIVVFSIVAVVCMKVLVSGSLRGLNESQKEPLRTAAKELGAALAAAGHTLLVGSEDTDDVDPFVVDGFLSVENASGVEVHLMRGAARCIRERPT